MTSLFDADFYPSPAYVIEKLTDGLTLRGKKILEPSAGRGDIVDYLNAQGSESQVPVMDK